MDEGYLQIYSGEGNQQVGVLVCHTLFGCVLSYVCMFRLLN